MKERPILFAGPMVRAILDGRKTQTRRLMKPQPVGRAGVVWPAEDRWAWSSAAGQTMIDERDAQCCCPHGYKRDRLWVRETFALAPLRTEPDPDDPDDWHPVYRADGDERPWLSSLDEEAREVKPPWKPSIFMPRWASRILLEITEVRVQRLQDITEADARAEGVTPAPFCKSGRPSGMEHVEAFEDLWDEINGDRATWASNPWVWAISFRRVP